MLTTHQEKSKPSDKDQSSLKESDADQRTEITCSHDPELSSCRHKCESENSVSTTPLICQVCADSISGIQTAIEALEKQRDTMFSHCMSQHRQKPSISY